ncbi:MAG: site-2 protease family protein [bacterium]
MRKSIKLVTLFDIPVEINISWFILLGLIVFTLAKSYFPLTNPMLTTTTHWAMAVLAAFLLFASLLAHELSHSLVAKRNALPIHGITLFIFGGVAHMEKEPQSPGIEFRMAIAGPLMSFAIALLFLVISRLAIRLALPIAFISIANYVFIINIVVGIFNLIPGFPLDGGRVLRATLWAIFKDLKKATAIATGLGKLFAFTLMGFGFINLFSGSFISGIWLIFIGLFLQESAEVSYRQVLMKKMLSGVKVEKLMSKEVITIPANITLDKLVDNYFFKYRHSCFPVMEDDTILGIVTLHDVKEVARDKWDITPAKDIMEPLDSHIMISKHFDAMEALPKIANNGIGRLLVIDHTKLIGILSQRDIMRLFEFKSEIEA